MVDIFQSFRSGYGTGKTIAEDLVTKQKEDAYNQAIAEQEASQAAPGDVAPSPVTDLATQAVKPPVGQGGLTARQGMGEQAFAKTPEGQAETKAQAPAGFAARAAALTPPQPTAPQIAQKRMLALQMNVGPKVIDNLTKQEEDARLIDGYNTQAFLEKKQTAIDNLSRDVSIASSTAGIMEMWSRSPFAQDPALDKQVRAYLADPSHSLEEQKQVIGQFGQSASERNATALKAAHEANALLRAQMTEKEKELDRLSREKNAAAAQSGADRRADVRKWEVVNIDGKPARMNVATGEVVPIDATSVAKVGSSGAPAGTGPGAVLRDVLGVTPSKSDATNQKIMDTANAVVSLNKLQTEFRDPEVKTGVMANLSPIIEKAKSLYGQDHAISDEEMKKIIDGQISPSAKNAVALKDALFASYMIEKEAAGGRLLISMMKQAGSALDPRSYEKEGYLNMLSKRDDELRRRLKGNLSTAQSEKLLNYLGGTGVSGQAKAMPDAATIQAYAAAHFKGDIGRAKEFLQSQGYK
jgi:hypothetical protein